MKRVSFKVAKAIKEAGYLQEYGEGTLYFAENGNQHFYDSELYPYYGEVYCIAPTYLEVWLWLWREKNIQICVEQRSNVEVFIKADFYALPKGFMKVFNDPEEAIASAIEYLVDNDLIK